MEQRQRANYTACAVREPAEDDWLTVVAAGETGKETAEKELGNRSINSLL